MGKKEAILRQLFEHFDWFSLMVVVDRWKGAKSPACNPMLFKLKRGQEDRSLSLETKPTLRRAMMPSQAAEKVED